MAEEKTSILEQAAVKVEEAMKPENIVDMTPSEQETPEQIEKRHKDDVKKKAVQEKAQVDYIEKKTINDKKDSRRIYFSKFKGLKIIVRSSQRTWDSINRKFLNDPGEHIKFENGKFITSDPKQIELLDEYLKQKPDYVFTIKPEDERLVRAIRLLKEADAKGQKQAIDLLEAEQDLRNKKPPPKGKQGVVSLG